jgi:hypothetical protein
VHDRRNDIRARGDDRLPASSTSASASTGGNRAEDVAVRLHAANRRRSQHFNAPVMADAAMDIMLSLFVAQEHKRPLTPAALAMANHIAQDRCGPLLDDLGQALLVTRSAPSLPVALTERGTRLMREYLEGLASLAA